MGLPSYEICIPSSTGGAEHRLLVSTPGAAQFAARLRKVARERRKWAKRKCIAAWRVYDRDLPDFCASIDYYEGLHCGRLCAALYISEYAAPKNIDPEAAAARFSDIVAISPVVFGVPSSRVFVKTRTRSKGGSQYNEATGNSWMIEVQEAGLGFEVNLGAYLDTGLFLDHRTTRSIVRSRAQGKQFLNLFAYTGTATVYAAAGGATHTTTVDLSQTYLDWAYRNMALNSFTGPMHEYVRADVLQWLSQAKDSDRRFDLVFVDPPTFSNSKKMGKRSWDVQRDHLELLVGVFGLLAPGGEAIFSCNLRTFKPDVANLAASGIELVDITAQTIPEDFLRNPRIHHCYTFSRSC